MTYSLTEKEEILYERQIDELFNLTEVTPLSGDKETYTDPATGHTYEVDPATAWRLKKADATAHYTDQYPSWDDPTAIPQQPIEPIELNELVLGTKKKKAKEICRRRHI
mgnify:CR=1 FL=1